MRPLRPIRRFLDRHPLFYALVAGVGLVLFWRGVWHTTDAIAQYSVAWSSNCPTTDLIFLIKVCSVDNVAFPLDGPLSFLIGSLMLLACGVFVSELLGKEIIISGLRGEKKLTERTEVEVRTETGAVGDIRDDLREIITRLDDLEENIDKKTSLR